MDKCSYIRVTSYMLAEGEAGAPAMLGATNRGGEPSDFRASFLAAAKEVIATGALSHPNAPVAALVERFDIEPFFDFSAK